MHVRAAHILVISTIAHGALLAYVAKWTALPRQRPKLDVAPTVDIPPTPVPTTAPAETLEVAFLDDSAPVIAATAPAIRPRGVVRTATTAIATTATGATAATGAETSTGPGPETTTGPGTGLMKMRGPNLGLDTGTAERIAGAGGAAPRDELRKSGRLESQPGGRAVIYDRVTTVSVDPDGKAHFADKKDIDLHFHLPVPTIDIEEIRQDLGHELTEWFKDPEAGKRYGRYQDLPRHLTAVEGACDSWSDVMCDDPLAPQTEARVRERKKVNAPLFGGGMDITAWLERKYVGDPYLSRKRKLLEDTFDERVEMRAQHDNEQSLRSGEFMRKNLERLWIRESNPIARRAALFELWDECGEDEPGVRARSIVIGWIRSHLPQGSATAYTTDEINALQAHCTGGKKFAPYE